GPTPQRRPRQPQTPPPPPGDTPGRPTPDERTQGRLEPVPLLSFHDGSDCRPELWTRLVERVRLENAAFGLQNLAERPERDSFPVGKAVAAPPNGRAAARLRRFLELRDETALARAGFTHHRDELDRGLAHCPCVRPLEQRN